MTPADPCAPGHHLRSTADTRQLLSDVYRVTVVEVADALVFRCRVPAAFRTFLSRRRASRSCATTLPRSLDQEVSRLVMRSFCTRADARLRSPSPTAPISPSTFWSGHVPPVTELVDPAHITHVLVSPRQRAQTTATLLFAASDDGMQDKVSWETTEEVGEWKYGAWEGLLVCPFAIL